MTPDDLADDDYVEDEPPLCLAQGEYDKNDPVCEWCPYGDDCKGGVDTREGVGGEPFGDGE